MLGETCRAGKGCGGKKHLGKEAFEESREFLLQHLGATDKIEVAIIFVAPGRGGTGTGAIVALCLALRQMDPIVRLCSNLRNLLLKQALSKLPIFTAFARK